MESGQPLKDQNGNTIGKILESKELGEGKKQIVAELDETPAARAAWDALRTAQVAPDVSIGVSVPGPMLPRKKGFSDETDMGD